MSANSKSDMQSIAEVLAAEEERCRACEAGDWEAMDELLHRDMIYTHADGKTQDKAVYFADLQTKQRRVNRTKLVIRIFGDSAVMSGGFSFGEVTTPDRIALQHWVKADGRWQMVAYQSTHLAQKWVDAMMQ